MTVAPVDGSALNSGARLRAVTMSMWISRTPFAYLCSTVYSCGTSRMSLVTQRVPAPNSRDLRMVCSTSLLSPDWLMPITRTSSSARLVS